MNQEHQTIALAGNPNSGKTSLFNLLTGLNQKVGNFPGVTVDKKTGIINLPNKKATLIDLPGSYGLDSNSEDEKVTEHVLVGKFNNQVPDCVIYVADASCLKRSLFFCTQIMDLGIRVILALNMNDIAEEDGIVINKKQLAQLFKIPIFSINARENSGIEDLKKAICDNHFVQPFSSQSERLSNTERYANINSILHQCVSFSKKPTDNITDRIDRIITHKIFGFATFSILLVLIFQSIFTFAEIPMQWIELSFSSLSGWLSTTLPEGTINDLLVEGVLAGLSGVIIFIPQITLLFFFIAIMEDTGYMARVSFITDRLMRNFGLNGRSVIPLISGVACAVPAIMSARTIGNWKERMITIMVTPLMTCAARLPVYVLLIALVIPSKTYLGFINLQGLTMLGLYLLGVFVALFSGWVLKHLIKTEAKSYFIMEMPRYRMPRWQNIGITIFEKVKVFTLDVGKIILAISILLWFLSSYAPGDRFKQIESKYANTTSEETRALISSEKLEASYAGQFGKLIEPIIRPLGFDWKIGIALVTSFAAREVFVGTMATIYSVGNEDNTSSLRQKMRQATFHTTGEKVYTNATGISLMLFYAFAMQCMSTIAVVYRETKHWKWPFIQLIYMSGLAYIVSFVAYQALK